MSDLVGNPEDRFSRVAAHIVQLSAVAMKISCQIFDCNEGIFTHLLCLLCAKTMLHRLMLLDGIAHGHQSSSFIAKCNDNKFICGTSHYAAVEFETCKRLRVF